MPMLRPMCIPMSAHPKLEKRYLNPSRFVTKGLGSNDWLSLAGAKMLFGSFNAERCWILSTPLHLGRSVRRVMLSSID